ncbi:MAG TPA: aminopeptidase N [Planctomycetes bacterium]|nr:aminopeptidase N [Planctomycetota bacterium]
MTQSAETTEPQAVYRKDYRPADFTIETVDLAFDLQQGYTDVTATLKLTRQGEAGSPLVLDGEELELRSVKVDGEALDESGYTLTKEHLTIPGLPERCTLETVVRIKPEENTELSGLYLSNGNYCTQCEAMGFRRITFFLDRPDVMARYTTRIEADKAAFPVLLSNGNRIESGEAEGGRHWVRWEDPYPKPSYLFALVAGDLHCHAGSFTTQSGREVRLEVWVEHRNADRCEHALRSLQQSMEWDEQVYGLEYDLDIYMIVAVDDFNMGAMENKGLNIFNSKYVLARPDTATDADYEAIQGVIGHEYFHNWTGNRVTCRDWFQLTLKEGLTVFRDQQFSSDMTSAPVKRIDDVRGLRVRQFAEDAGPMRHPIRPDSYVSMDNFYTGTVYRKGAEVVGIYHTLLGKEGFRKGMDLYFERHDGQAVTCVDFRQAMADANGVDLSQMENWYSQSGTPLVEAVGEYDADAKTYALTLRQRYTLDDDEERKPVLIPVAMGLLAEDGSELPLQLEGEDAAAGTSRVLQLTEAEQTFTFQQVPSKPVPSLLRDFSAPVRLKSERSRDELAFLMAHDTDAFNRWDAGQTLMSQILLELAEASAAGRELSLDPSFVEAWGKLLADASLDGSLKAQALVLPAEAKLAQDQAVIDPDALHVARQFARRELAGKLEAQLVAAYEQAQTGEPYSLDKAAVDRRRLKNCVLAYLATLDKEEHTARVLEQLRKADNMTDAQAALYTICDRATPQREAALEEFHAKWKDDPLVLDKWFTAQAVSSDPGTVADVRALIEHADFSWTNPNRVRSLLGAFAMANQARFHQADGSGYTLLGDSVLKLDAINPQVTARLVSSFNQWRRFDEKRQLLQQKELERIAAKEGLSKDTGEIVGRALKS